jgi:hypothetical protein
MRLELEIQYADYDPDQVDRIGAVELDHALKVIDSYPWEKEFAKIDERAKGNLTSTVPNVTIRNRENELLTISARDKDNHIIEFQGRTQRGELIIPINRFDNRTGFTTAEIVSRFYDGLIKESIKLRPNTKLDTTVMGNVYKVRDYPVFISGVTVVVLTLILVLDFWANGLTRDALPAVYFIGAIIASMGFSALLTIQYLITDWGKDVSFGSDGSITIKNRRSTVTIARGDIDQVCIVENESHRTLSNYKYARIKTKSGKAFIVTSFVMEPIDLVNKLRINHKDESVFLPTISLDIVSAREKERLRRNKEKKRIEFLEVFKEYDDSKLRQIVQDKKNYADYVVEAAEQILENRKRL